MNQTCFKISSSSLEATKCEQINSQKNNDLYGLGRYYDGFSGLGRDYNDPCGQVTYYNHVHGWPRIITYRSRTQVAFVCWVGTIITLGTGYVL